MKYCKRCLYPENHPLGIVLDDEGVCSGCRVHEEKYTLDWRARFEKLKTIVHQYKSTTGKTYDCLVPISGAQDSFYIIHVLKNILGLNPLLVHYNRHYNTEIGLKNLAHLRTAFDCDFKQKVVNPHTVRRVVRDTLKRMGSMHWHVLAGQTVFPVQTAVQLKIPLIIWGTHQGLDQVGMFSHCHEVEMTRRYRKDHDLMGWEAEDIMAAKGKLGEEELHPYFYPDDQKMASVGVRGIYLGNYIPWDSKAQHEEMLKLYGYRVIESQRTFDTYNHVDCRHYTGLHDWIKYCKWGYGKVVDHACREIRLKRLTRQQGRQLVAKYQNVKPMDKEDFMRWSLISEFQLESYVDRFRDPKAWTLEGTEWISKGSVVDDQETEEHWQQSLIVVGNCSFLQEQYEKSEEERLFDSKKPPLIIKGHPF